MAACRWSRRTGGLADTVIDANEAAVAAGVATGFQFAPANGEAFMQAIRRVVALYADRQAWLSHAEARHEGRRLLGHAAPSATPNSTRP